MDRGDGRIYPSSAPWGTPYAPRGSPRLPRGGSPRAVIAPTDQKESPFILDVGRGRVGAVIQHGDSQSRRLSDVSRSQAGDVTLQNLLGVLVTKLDSCRRLPLFAFEAANEGHTTCAQAFRDLADAERAALDSLLDHLQDHLAERDHQRKGIRP